MAERIRVLYVDDEPGLLQICKLFLERSGRYSVDTIESAVAALPLLTSGYDAVISDYQMPGMDGIEFLKRVRASGNTVPFILFTGRGREEVVIQAIDEGADFYVQKGGDPKAQFAELTHKVQIAVENHQAAEKIQTLNRLYSVLSATNRAMVRLRTKADFFSEICRILVETGGFRLAWIGIADLELKAILPAASAGHDNGYLDRVDISTEDIPRGRGPTGTAYREGRYYVVNDIATDPRMEPWREGALKRGYLANSAIPFALGTRNAGVLTLYAPVTGFFDDQIIGLLDELAMDISFALQTIDEEADRKAAEESIRDLEQKEADLINFLPDATFAIDRAGRIILWNRAIEEGTGMPAAEMLGKGDYEYAIPFYGRRRPILIDLISEPDEVVARRYGHIVRDRDILIADTTVTLPNGKEVVLMGKAGPLYNREGEVVGAIESFWDITRLVRAEENLVESEGRFAAFMDRLPVTAFIKDAQSTILYVNRPMGELFGAGDWVGRSVREFFPADVAEKMIEDDRRALAEGYRRAVEHLTTKTGEQRIFETYKFRIDRENKPPLIGGFAVDITDRTRAEDAIRESEQRYYSIIEDQTEFVCRFSPNGTHVFANEAYCRYFGLRREEILGHRFRPVVPAEDRERLDRFFASLTPDHPVDSIEHRIVMPDGTVQWQRWSDRAIFDASGGVVEYQSVGRDITEEMATRAALEASETRFRKQYQNNPLPIFTWQHRDGEFVLVDCNRAAEILSEGRSRAILGRTVSELDGLQPGHRSQIERSFFERTPLSQEFVSGYFLPGKRILGTTAFVPPDLVMVHMDDVTERKRAEELMRTALRRLDSLVSNLNTGVIMVSEDGLIEHANRTFCDLFEIDGPPEGLIGRPAQEIMDRGREIFADPDATIARLGENFVRSEPLRGLEVALRNGRFVTVEHVPIVDADGRCAGRIWHLQEITERKRAEMALRQANDKLTLLFRITRHDITNQLSLLIGYLTVLGDDQMDDESRRYIRIMLTAAERIAAMLRFTKTYEEIGVQAPAWHDCRALVDAVTLQVPLGKVAVTNAIPAGTEILADPLIIKVWYTLLENAVRHGGTITTIRFSEREFDGDHQIICEDDGDGIPPDLKERIFEQGVGKNTGFGLFLAREIFATTGITIRENGETGKGARFEITVPKQQYRSAPRP
ncbi:MAG: PAS domain S-box protein [Methanospirillum sp.]